jgi:nucleolar protein 56
MPTLFLYESALGYGLFKIKEASDLASSLKQVQRNLSDFKVFSDIAKLKSFLPFKDSQESLDNLNAISEGVLPKTLESFLESNVSKGNKLAVSDTKLGGAIQDTLKIESFTDQSIMELGRGIKFHFEKFLKEITKEDVEKSQLGLGHAYSRSKIKFNMNKSDNMVIQSIALIDQLDKDINTFSMRLKEWYSWHFPELSKLTKIDNEMFAKLVLYMKQKSSLSTESLHGLTEITQDEDLSKDILEAARSSMGLDLSEFDMLNVEVFAQRVHKLIQYRKHLFEYLQTKMKTIAPNMTVLMGEMVGARLISHAGSLVNLSKYPASTIQILGAEKALFRALKTKGNTPKYGLIYHSSFIGRSTKQNKGRVSRYLANKCAVAARIDTFSEFPTSKYGEKMRDQVEERINFYEKGVQPTELKKNADIMKEVSKVVQKEMDDSGFKKSSKKRKQEDAQVEENSEKKKKSKKDKEDKEEKKEKKEKKSKEEKKEKKEKKDKDGKKKDKKDK